MPTKFNMVGIFVQDIHRMVAFYRDVLGVEVDWNETDPYAEFKHEGIRISMYARDLLPQLPETDTGRWVEYTQARE